MRELDPFDASILSVLAQVPQEMTAMREELLSRLSQEGREIADALLAEDPALLNTSEDVRVTAESMKLAARTH